MADYPYFPMFVDLSAKRAVVVGAGRIAARRVGALARFCGDITVIAPEVRPEIEAMPGIAVRRRPYRPEDLDGAELVLAATGDAALNAGIAAACHARGIPVNVSSDRGACDFYFPGVIVDGDVAVGVTASGRDHARARAVTEAIRQCLSDREA